MTDEGELLAGRYRLVSQVGTGAMGVVWQAHDEQLNRVVAVKQLLHTGLSGIETDQANRRAMREARITARLHHPHAIVVYDVVESAGRPYLIMEYLPSQSLSTAVAERGPLPPAEVARIGSQIAGALAAAHDAGIVHRDIKPGNVLLAADGTAKITDFGVSHAVGDCTVTATGILLGTPAYLAPEVARGAQAGFPADVFALGATLYAAVEGTPPFGVDDNPLALLYRIASNEIIPPTRSGPLSTVLSDLLDRHESRRPTMQQAREALATADTAPTVIVPGAPAAAGIPTAVTTPVGVPGTIELPPLPASGSAATVSPPAGTSPGTAKLALAGGSQAGGAPAGWPPTEGGTRPRRPAAVLAVAAASVLVAGLMLVATLINDRRDGPGSAAGPPSATPGTGQSEQAPQRAPEDGGAQGADPILATIPALVPRPGIEPSRSPDVSPGAAPTSDPSETPTSETSAVPSSETSAVPSSETSAVPSPELGSAPSPEPSEVRRSPEPTPAPERAPRPGPPSDAGRP
ncbi:MAG: protein kinase domain-containing protein [Pseudonocardiaceae bacterium]